MALGCKPGLWPPRLCEHACPWLCLEGQTLEMSKHRGDPPGCSQSWGQDGAGRCHPSLLEGLWVGDPTSHAGAGPGTRRRSCRSLSCSLLWVPGRRKDMRRPDDAKGWGDRGQDGW